jgi:3-oxoacyl-[acyl-carrier protein] reductase
MLLENKNAIIYGGGGSIGGAVAKEFAREGAKVFLAGRTREKLEAVAERFRSAGGAAETAQVDALDEKPVEEYADAVAREAGGIDVSFNLISYPSVHGTPLAEMAVEDFTNEAMRRQLACELGPHGIRVVTLRTGGVPESIPESVPGRESIIEKHIVEPTMLGRGATLADVGNAAAFAASDRARTMTAATVNISCGALVD